MIAVISYNQTQRNSDNENSTTRQTTPNKNQKNPVPKSNTQQERKAPATSNHTTTPQRPSNDRTISTNQTNRNQGSTGREQDSRTRENSQNPETRPNTTPVRHDRPDNYDRGHNTGNTTTSVSVNRPYVRQTDSREYESPRIDRERHVPIHPYTRPPAGRDYRVQHFVYRAPVELNIYWSRELSNHYIRIYPMVRSWNYPIGYHIESIPAYDANDYKGAVITVYGQINEAYYSPGTDEYFLYFGPFYPYQDFTVVMPGWLARQYSRMPDMFFANRNLATTGMITSFEGDPEIVVKEAFQLDLY